VRWLSISKILNTFLIIEAYSRFSEREGKIYPQSEDIEWISHPVFSYAASTYSQPGTAGKGNSYF
jgi:hypothetical protein